MEVVPTSAEDDDGVMWLRCPRCQGFLPKISPDFGRRAAPDRATDERAAMAAEPGSSASAGDSGVTSEVEAPAEESTSPLGDIDPSQAVLYRPWNSYPIGTVIHHLAWNDYGIVVAKEQLPGQRRAVKVRFEKAGIVRLIEESGEEQ